jgi:hypothetical protein
VGGGKYRDVDRKQRGIEEGIKGIYGSPCQILPSQQTREAGELERAGKRGLYLNYECKRKIE